MARTHQLGAAPPSACSVAEAVAGEDAAAADDASKDPALCEALGDAVAGLQIGGAARMDTSDSETEEAVKQENISDFVGMNVSTQRLGSLGLAGKGMAGICAKGICPRGVFGSVELGCSQFKRDGEPARQAGHRKKKNKQVLKYVLEPLTGQPLGAEPGRVRKGDPTSAP